MPCKVEPSERHAHDTAGIVGASHHVHGTTKVAEEADHAYLHATTAVARATIPAQITDTSVDASDHEHDIAGVADSADAAWPERKVESTEYVPPFRP